MLDALDGTDADLVAAGCLTGGIVQKSGREIMVMRVKVKRRIRRVG
jgi:hypothetical protein